MEAPHPDPQHQEVGEGAAPGEPGQEAVAGEEGGQVEAEAGGEQQQRQARAEAGGQQHQHRRQHGHQRHGCSGAGGRGGEAAAPRRRAFILNTQKHWF